MSRLSRTAVVAAAGLLYVFSIGCMAMTVGSHVDRLAGFGGYRTWDWGPADALPTSDPRLDGDPFFNDHLQGAVERGLAARGWTLTSDEPDLLIHYHANVTEQIDVNRVDQQYRYCYGSDCAVQVLHYEAGTLVLDIVDRRTNRLVWRGWAQNSMDDVLGNRDRMERTINEAVTRMLKQLPRSM